MTRDELVQVALLAIKRHARSRRGELVVAGMQISDAAGDAVDAILAEMAGEWNAAIEAAARLAAGEPHLDHYRRWPWWGIGDRSTDSELVIFCDALAAQIRALRRPDAAPAEQPRESPYSFWALRGSRDDAAPARPPRATPSVEERPCPECGSDPNKWCSLHGY